MVSGISVAIAVGPEAHHQQYLEECLQSVAEQTLPPVEVFIVDDMAGLPQGMNHENPYPIRTWHAPWRMGIAAAYNCGVSLAESDLVFMLGADDKLLPSCLEKCLASYQAEKGADSYYGVGVRYSDGREDQYIPCQAAMVTKGLWRFTGGFPPEAGVGAPDAALLSIIFGNDLVKPVCVDPNEPLYWYRVHDQSDTKGRAGWQGAILATRNLVTANWKQPRWGRYK